MAHDAYMLAKQHYENFPVISICLPKKIRRAVALIYAFARTADDIADEGDAAPNVRLSQLSQLQDQLIYLSQGEKVSDPFFTDLGHMIETYQLDYKLFFRLLQAFVQDIQIKRYAHYRALLRYCHNSANPVGALLLQLMQQDTSTNLRMSHALCTALQLINFWQDIQSDYTTRQRIYLPQADLQYYQVPEETLACGQPSAPLQQVLAIQYQRVAELLQKSKPLCSQLSGGLKWQVRLTFVGAQEMLKRLRERPNPLFRPSFAWYDWPILTAKACYLSN